MGSTRDYWGHWLPIERTGIEARDWEASVRDHWDCWFGHSVSRLYRCWDISRFLDQLNSQIAPLVRWLWNHCAPHWLPNYVWKRSRNQRSNRSHSKVTLKKPSNGRIATEVAGYLIQFIRINGSRNLTKIWSQSIEKCWKD